MLLANNKESSWKNQFYLSGMGIKVWLSTNIENILDTIPFFLKTSWEVARIEPFIQVLLVLGRWKVLKVRPFLRFWVFIWKYSFGLEACLSYPTRCCLIMHAMTYGCKYWRSCVQEMLYSFVTHLQTVLRDSRRCKTKKTRLAVEVR